MEARPAPWASAAVPAAPRSTAGAGWSASLKRRQVAVPTSASAITVIVISGRARAESLFATGRVLKLSSFHAVYASRVPRRVVDVEVRVQRRSFRIQYHHDDARSGEDVQKL